jgi:hypothetical protein
MNKDQMLRIGLAINNIAMSVDDETLKKIEPYLKQIEQTVLEDKE